MQWQDLNFWYWSGAGATRWLNERKLRELGFDCTLAPPDPKAPYLYRKQDPKPAFGALAAPENQRSPSATRLAAVDAALSRAALRARYPDRNRVLILPVMIRISLVGGVVVDGRSNSAAYLAGYMQQVLSRIHVPRPFADGFRRLPDHQLSYRVKLRYGQLLEPWVTSVELP